MMACPLEELQQWYAHRCDGNWEHRYGIEIRSLDNPGWQVRVDLKETPLAGLHVSPTVEGRPRGNVYPSVWLDCRVQDDTFLGHGNDLGAILRVFLLLVGDQHEVP